MSDGSSTYPYYEGNTIKLGAGNHSSDSADSDRSIRFDGEYEKSGEWGEDELRVCGRIELADGRI